MHAGRVRKALGCKGETPLAMSRIMAAAFSRCRPFYVVGVAGASSNMPSNPLLVDRLAYMQFVLGYLSTEKVSQECCNGWQGRHVQ